jgi:hypothetical protein
MRIVDPETGRSYVEKRRVLYNEPGQLRELTFSCYRHHAFLGYDRTREWFCAALDEARTEFAFQLWAYVVLPEHVHVLSGSPAGFHAGRKGHSSAKCQAPRYLALNSCHRNPNVLNTLRAENRVKCHGPGGTGYV